MKRKLFILCLLLVLVGTRASAYDFKVDGIYYNITSSTNLTASVTYKDYDHEYNQNAYVGDIIIPQNVTYDGKSYSVTSIDDYAFVFCVNLTSIIIPNSVTSIGYAAFSNCFGLRLIVNLSNLDLSLSRPNMALHGRIINVKNIEKIENFFFTTVGDTLYLTAYIGNDKELTLPENYKGANYEIGSEAFYFSTSLTSITIPNSVTSIGDEAFYGCSGLTSITIPNSVTSIGDEAFYGCSGLTSITIPNSVTSIGNWAFRGCSGLTSITIPNSVTSIGYGTFYGCSGLTSITIPNSVTSIGEYAFYNCSGLTSITIPNSVTSIGLNAFYNCRNLSAIYISDLEAWCNIVFNGSFLNDWHLYLNKEKIKDLVIPNTITEIKDHAFCGCSSLTSITIPNSVTSIGRYAFCGCSSLTSITIPNSVTSIGNSAFQGCSGLTSITIPNSVTSIGEYAFYNCSGLTSITIPNSVTSIGNSAFYGCSSLSTLIVEAFTPPFITSSTFNYSHYTGTTVIVDKDVLSKYQRADIWEKFKNWDTKDIISLDITSTEITVGESIILKATIDSDNFGNAVTWTSSNTDVATVDDNGKISALSAGKITITAKVGEYTAKCTVTVNRRIIEVSGITLDKSTIELTEGETATLTATVTPSDATNKTVTWITSDATIATVENGVVRTLKPGEVTITAKAGEFIASCKVKINHAQFTLTYMLDGIVYKKSAINYGSALIPEANPVKEGYTFSGWSEVPSTMPAKDVTIEGTFTVNSYNLVYMVDGVEFNKTSVEFGAAITALEAPTKEGYTFSGWNEVPSTMPAKDVTITGTFSVNSYNLVYMVDGVEFNKTSVEFGAAITALEAPTKEGYTFSGWSEVPSTMPAKDVTIEGSFSVNSYNLVYMVDGVEFNKTSVEFGAAITALEVPTKEGYTFSGWSEVPSTMPAKDVTITGSFSVNSYNLVYMVDGVEFNKTSVEFGAAITALEVPTKEGYTFSGWSEIPETMPAKDVTIEGSFSINTYTITYMVDGEVYATEQITYGSTITLKDAPVKEGYIFSGWSEAPETMPAEDVVIEGTFTVDGIDAVVTNRLVDVYTLQGVMVKRQIPVEEFEQELPVGIYIVNGKKMVIK